jgi:hypothetical protein
MRLLRGHFLPKLVEILGLYQSWGRHPISSGGGVCRRNFGSHSRKSISSRLLRSRAACQCPFHICKRTRSIFSLSNSVKTGSASTTIVATPGDICSTFAAKIASAGNFNGSKNCSGCARSKILDALILATPEASPVSSTKHIHLGLNNSSLHFSKYGLAFDQLQTDLFGPDS